MSRRGRNAPLRALAFGRDQLMSLAQSFANYCAKRIPFGARVVVVVTDTAGEWVGVGSNTNPVDVAAILGSALRGADRRDGKIIEATGEERAP